MFKIKKIICLFLLTTIIICGTSLSNTSTKGDYSPLAPDTFYYLGNYIDNVNLDYVRDLWHWGDYIFTGANHCNNLTILDASDRDNLVEISSISVGGHIRGIDISSDGKYAFLGSQSGGPTLDGNFTIINITDIYNPTIESVIVIDATDGAIVYVDYVDSTQICYVCDYMNGDFLSYDCSNKLSPVLLDSYDTGGLEQGGHGVWANETRAVFITYKDDTLYLMDVSDPTNMLLLDSVSNSRTDGGWFVYGQGTAPIIYTTNLYYGATIYNISGDTLLQKSATSFYGGGNVPVTVIPFPNQTRMFVTQGLEPLYIGTLYSYNIVNPASPSLVTSVNNATYPLYGMIVGGTTVIDNYVYVACSNSNSISIFRYGDIEPIDTTIYFISIDGGSNQTIIYNGTPTFNWSKISTAIQYNLQISNTSSFASSDLVVNITNINLVNYPTYYSENTTDVSFRLPNEYALPIYKTYYCRARYYH